MSEQQTISPRKRMHALLAIPDSQRTDAQWDELNELEIMTAPVNQLSAAKQGVRRGPPNRSRHAKNPHAKPVGNSAVAGEQRRKPIRKRRKPPVKTVSS